MAALHRYEILDTPREPSFDRITGLVRAVLNVPISTLSLIDSDRQWYKSCVGMESTDLPRELSFCTHTIQSRSPLCVPDTLKDARFAQYPSVTGEPFIRSYLGIPLATPDGYVLGALCALDVQPREFNVGQIEVMKSFAALAENEFELRRIAQIDSLTGAATRRSFLIELEKAEHHGMDFDSTKVRSCQGLGAYTTYLFCFDRVNIRVVSLLSGPIDLDKLNSCNLALR